MKTEQYSYSNKNLFRCNPVLQLQSMNKGGGKDNLKVFLVFGLAILSVSSIIFLIFGYFRYQSLVVNLKNTELQLQDVESRLFSLQEERDYIYKNLLSEQAKNTLFENQIKEITGSIDRLDKLSKTDKELLQKYSKVYFLNEHYVPDALTEINKEYLYEPSRKMYFHTKAYPFLENMLNDAKNEGVDLKIISAYRSFAEQTSLKNGYSVTYGSGANQFSADQGYSEHQLGTTVDFTTFKTGTNFNAFKTTDSYKWLIDNAYKYGFILSYPDGNKYYQYEPWHWRFVGRALALRLHEERENFYDLKQSQIDPYLITIFD